MGWICGDDIIDLGDNEAVGEAQQADPASQGLWSGLSGNVQGRIGTQGGLCGVRLENT